MAKGIQAYKETGDLKKAGLAAGQSGLGEYGVLIASLITRSMLTVIFVCFGFFFFRAVKVANNVPGAQIGLNLLNDLQNGESVQTIILNGY